MRHPNTKGAKPKMSCVSCQCHCCWMETSTGSAKGSINVTAPILGRLQHARKKQKKAFSFTVVFRGLHVHRSRWLLVVFVSCCGRVVVAWHKDGEVCLFSSVCLFLVESNLDQRRTVGQAGISKIHFCERTSSRICKNHNNN